MRETFLIEQNMTIATTKVAAIQITTPATGVTILKPVAFVSDVGPIVASLFEDYSFSDVGFSTLAPINTNRRATGGTSNLVVKAIPDATVVQGANDVAINQFKTPTAPIDEYFVGKNEIILKASTDYLIAFTNSNAGNAVVNFAISWTEQ